MSGTMNEVEDVLTAESKAAIDRAKAWSVFSTCASLLMFLVTLSVLALTPLVLILAWRRF